jgi:mycobactin lysine-N-oxygenase
VPALAVVGAGPKGIAIAANARALSRVGLDAPRVVLVARSAVAVRIPLMRTVFDARVALGSPRSGDDRSPDSSDD